MGPRALDDYIDLMAGVPQIAADPPQRTSRQPWATSRHCAIDRSSYGEMQRSGNLLLRNRSGRTL